VPFPAGGPSDVLARMIGQKMTEDWHQPVVIENRVGANTVIGAQAVRQAPGDGYTMLMAIDSTLTMNQYLYRTPPYDPKGTPAPIVAKIQAEVVKALADSSIKSKADVAGLFPATSTPAEFGTFIKKEAERWSKVVAESGMKYD
jgi:tripartite-type tricarboxylate transporter receptor subunit TctC